MNESIRMVKGMVECFTADVLYDGRKVQAVFVPLFGRRNGWVGPGYWEPQCTGRVISPPPYKYNTKVYTREELVNAGAKQKFEYLWMR